MLGAPSVLPLAHDGHAWLAWVWSCQATWHTSARRLYRSLCTALSVSNLVCWYQVGWQVWDTQAPVAHLAITWMACKPLRWWHVAGTVQVLCTFVHFLECVESARSLAEGRMQWVAGNHCKCAETVQELRCVVVWW